MKLAQTLTVLSIILACEAANAVGQDTLPSVQLGDRIRISYRTSVTKHFAYVIRYHTNETRSATGSLIRWDSLVVVDTGRPEHTSSLVLQTSNVTQLKYQDGSRRATLEGAGIGTAIGLGLSLAAIAPTAVDGPSENDGTSSFEDRLIAVPILVGSGAAIGAIIGYFIHTDRWKNVDRSDWPVSLALSEKRTPTVTLVLRF